VLAAILWRRLASKFPFFLLYTGFEVCLSVVLMVLELPEFSSVAWGRTYLWGNAISTMLRFGVIYEVFRHLFRNYSSLQRFGQPLFRGALLLFLAVSLILSFFTPFNGGDHAMFVLHLLEQTANIMQTGLLLSLFIFSAYIGLSWRNYVFGIALGMGIYAAVKLASAALQAAGYIRSGSNYINLLTMGTFVVSDFIWIAYLVLPERKPFVSLAATPTNEMEPWSEELRRLIKQ
jgi:hypothetical protein